MPAASSAPPPAAPPGTDSLFGAAWPRVLRYADLLCGPGIERGLLGPRESSRIWERHIRNSLAVTPFLREGCSVIDLGSGAGLPGIPVALARPDLQITAVESMARRVAFLQLAQRECELANFRIEHARAESARTRGDFVICRAVAPLARLLPWAHRLVDGNGTLVALKGQNIDDEIADVTALATGQRSPRWLPDDMSVSAAKNPDPAVVFIARWQQSGVATSRAGRGGRGTPKGRASR